MRDSPCPEFATTSSTFITRSLRPPFPPSIPSTCTTMAPKRQKPVPVDPTTATGTSIPSRPGVIPTTSLSSSSTHARPSSKPLSFSMSHLGTATQELWISYLDNTPNSLLIIDAFLMFLMYVGGVQFVYACLTGGYPFNSFLAGFAAAVGQFVLAGMVSLTIFSCLDNFPAFFLEFLSY